MLTFLLCLINRSTPWCILVDLNFLPYLRRVLTSLRIFWTIHQGYLSWSVPCSRTYTTYLQLLYTFTILYYRERTKHVRYSRVNNDLVYPQILWTKGYVVYTPVWFFTFWYSIPLRVCIIGIREVFCLAQLTCITLLFIIEIHVLTTCFNPVGVIFRLTLLRLISITKSGWNIVTRFCNTN